MTITVTAEELEEFPEVELPDIEFDADKVLQLLEVLAETKDALKLQPFNTAASIALDKMAKELKETVDKAMEDYKKACDEREAKILKARADKLKEEEEKEKESEDA